MRGSEFLRAAVQAATRGIRFAPAAFCCTARQKADHFSQCITIRVLQNPCPEIPLFRLGKAAIGGFNHRIHDLFGGILRDMQLFCRIFPHRKTVQQIL